MLEFKHIYKTYNRGELNEAVIFEDFSLKVERGEFVTIIGSNGSGKSSLLNLLCGEIFPDSGEIILNGKDVTRVSAFERAKIIGRVFQDPAMGACAGMTILENMALADNKNKPYGLAKAVNRDRLGYYRDVLRTLEMGLDEKLEAKVGSLSGGQRQALSLILACIRENLVLVLDEHTAALDPKTSETMMALTQKLVDESEPHLTTLMVTHNLAHALNYGNRLVMMHRGKVILDVSGEEKAALKMPELMEKFQTISFQ